MRYIANILTEKAFSDDAIYNVVHEKADLIEGIPTLVIGWKFTKAEYPEASIIDWKINDMTYWTFGSRERRNIYEVLVPKFKDLAVKMMLKSVKYNFFSILTASEEEKKEFYNSIKNEEEKYAFSCNDMVYVCFMEKKTIIGVSLHDISYEKKDVKKFFSFVYSNSEVVETKDKISWETRNSLKNCEYALAYLCS